MPSYRPDPQMQQKIDDLLPLYADTQIKVLRAAIDELWWKHFGQVTVSTVIGWDQFTLAQPMQCDATGELLPAGTEAWREVWSDNRPGRILSQRGLDNELA